MKKHLLTVVVLFVVNSSFCLAQNLILYGTTGFGGKDGTGNIFQFNLNNSTYNNDYNFGNIPSGTLPYSTLIQANDGLLYGTTFEGGIYGDLCVGASICGGTIFSYNIYTNKETDLHNFGKDTDGEVLNGSLIQASNGLLYGLTALGGADDSPSVAGDGTIFSYDISTGIEKDIHDFGYNTDGDLPNGSLIQGSDGLLYGMTIYGGIYGFGTIFNYNISTGQETVLHNFGENTDGQNPYGSLMQATNGLLYGMTQAGGTNGGTNGSGGFGLGTIFSYNISTGIETDIHDFGNASDGNSPLGSLIQGSDGLLYGMTTIGGTYVYGTIFSYNISTGAEIVLHNFGENTDGIEPYSSLIQANNGLLYGTTSTGGVNNDGTIFTYNISTGIETVLRDFTDTDGKYPNGGLIEVDSTTGINQLSINNQLSISPNPTSGQFTIKTSGDQTWYMADIYNILGERIYQSVLNNSQNIINLSSQPDGMYFVYLKSDEGVEVQKVLLTK